MNGIWRLNLSLEKTLNTNIYSEVKTENCINSKLNAKDINVGKTIDINIFNAEKNMSNQCCVLSLRDVH